MKITRCIVDYKVDGIHQDELRIVKSEFQPFYDGTISINEMVENLHHKGRPLKDTPGYEIECVEFDIEDEGLPENTVLTVYLVFDDDVIAVGLLEYDDDSNVRLPLREIFVGNIHGDPLADDGKQFFIGDLTQLVEDHVAYAKEDYERKMKGN